MSVTVLLTLKGRPLHTLRWLWVHNQLRLPFDIVIADGGDDGIAEKVLARPNQFPNLSYRYLRYDDATVSDFWYKLDHAVAGLDTSYVAISDNDDFVMPSGLAAASSFLDGHPDYVSAGGPQVSFSLFDGIDDPLVQVMGDLYSLSSQTATDCYGSDGYFERIRAFFQNRHSFYYNLHRRPALSEIFSGAKRLDFRNFDVWENYIYLSLLRLGKVKLMPDIAYIRQTATSQAHGSSQDWLRNLFFKDWMGDFLKMVEELAQQAEQSGHGRRNEAYELIHDAVAAIAGRSAPSPRAGQALGARLAQAGKRWKPVRGLYLRRCRAQVSAGMMANGATSGAVTRFGAELDQLRKALIDPALRTFLQQTMA